MTVRRAVMALAAISVFVGASSAALAKSKKRHHRHHHHHKRGGQGGGGSAAEGREHLKRANALAGAGDCQSAIDEYIKAYEQLKDPVLLFNRGECFRRVGDNDAAIDDYREFLEKVPNAPNRADIEAKIAALEAPESPPSAEAQPAAPAKTPPKTPPQPKSEPPPKAAAAGPAPPPAPKPEEATPEPAVAIRRAAPAETSGKTEGSRPWVWVALSVLVVGAGVAGYLLLRPREEPPPGTALGNYRF